MPPRFASHPGSIRSFRPALRARAFPRWLAVLLLGVVAPVAMGAGAAAEAATRGLREKQMNPMEHLGITRPIGLAYAGDADLFIVVPAPDASGVTAATEVGLMDRFQQPVGAIDLRAVLSNPRAVAYDRKSERLLMLDVASRSLRAIPGGAAGTFATDRATRFEAPRVGPMRPVGMTVDPATGRVFVLDRLLRRIVSFTPAAADADPATLAAVPEAQTIALGALATVDLSGLAFDPESGHLFTLAPARRTLYELALDGSQVASYDVSGIRLSDPQSMVFAPSGDQTDDPATLSLFVADAGAPGSRRGHVIEMAWTDPNAVFDRGPGVLAVTAATLVRVTKTSLFSPPSPDPSGLAYDPVTGRLVMDDGEVDEMGIYAGKQVWETTLAGTVVRSYNVLNFTNEPVGIACNPNNRHVLFSDDDHDRVWDVAPGPDNLVGTADDTRTTFSTAPFGSGDPEGLGYDPVGNRLFVTDGLNNEIYVLRAGPNGTFEGGGDDQITHFDTAKFGIQDTDMVEWKPDTGTLLTLGSNGVRIVKEVTDTGTLVSEVNVSSFPLNQPAGLAYAPSSGGGGWSIYIVNRAIDNNSNPNENDGTLVEISVGGTVPPPTNTAPVTSAGPDRTITMPASASLDGTVTDDNLPSPPNVTTTWAKVSGPGTVTFVNANAVDTQASFSANGTYVLSLTASDGQLSSSDQMQVIAQPAGSPNAAPQVGAGPDLNITLPAQANLDGTVTDDNLPSPPSMTTTWAKVSGPGTVTFLNANAVDTQASFSAPGTYVLSLTANDGQLSTTDQAQVIAQTGGGGGTVTEVRIASGPDDVEQAATGSVYTNSSDLELVFDGSNQIVGLRFPGVAIAKNAAIATAWIQFQADEAQSEVTTLSIQGQATDNAGVFGTTSGSLSALSRTAASVGWTPAAWNTVGETAAAQRTPELKTVIQELVNQPGWASGNAMAILITGTGHRTARAYEGAPAAAALLHIELATVNSAPTVNAGVDQTMTLPASAALDGTVSDDGLPTPPALTTTWSQVSGPGTVSFANGNAVDTQASFSVAGTYVLQLAAGDGALNTSDQVQITVLPVGSNAAPIVGAGPDRTIQLPAQAVLDGSVSDDALPSPPSITSTWSKVSGPGTVTFANANAIDTQASFSVAGTYVLQLTASDGQLSGSDQMQVTATPANTAPVVNAGPDLDVIMPAQAVLNATVSDDGLPSPPALTYTWSKVSGPGTVTFANPNVVDTQASFSAAGTYVVRLSVTDGALTTTDLATVTVWPAGTILKRIATSSDDAEESATGSVSTNNNDLEMVFSGSNQVVGLRFTSLAIPQGAIIASAAIQFQADETQSEATSLTIQGQAAGTTATFTNTNLNVSSRPRTTNAVTWTPAAWSAVGDKGPNQRTPDIKNIIQEIVSRPDWVSGNSIVIIISGTGHRTAETYDGLASAAARLELQIQ